MSPIIANDLDLVAGRASATSKKFIKRTGREIYDEQMISGMNKMPVSTLISFIIGGTQFENPPFDIEELAEYLLIEGSVLIVDNEIQEGVCSATNIEVVQDLPVTDPVTGSVITRVYTRTIGEWTVVDYVFYGMSDRQKQISINAAPDKSVYVYPNGTGVLFPVQKQLWRIERIYQVMEKQTTGQGLLKKLISGYLGDINQIRVATADDDISVYGVPGGDVKGIDLATEVIINNQIAQLDRLEPVYLRNVHVIGTVDASNISGISRTIYMTPMTTFVEKVRGWITEICAQFNYTPVFERLPLQGIDERKAEFELLKELRDAQVISQAEFTAKARELTT